MLATIAVFPVLAMPVQARAQPAADEESPSQSTPPRTTPTGNDAAQADAPQSQPASLTHSDDAATRAHGRHLQGRVLAEHGQYDAAITQLTASYAIRPLPEIQFELAEVYRAKGDAPNAVRAYNAYIALVSEGDLAERSRASLAVLTRSPEVRRWQRIIDRGLTLDAGRVGAKAGLDWVGGWFMPDAAHADRAQGVWAFAHVAEIEAGYGLRDEITLAGAYAGGTTNAPTYDPLTGALRIGHPYDRGQATIYGAYRVMHAPRYSVAVTASVSEYFESNTPGIGAGVIARYRISKRLAVLTGNGPIAPTNSTKVHLGFTDGLKASLAFAGALEVQWTPRLYMNITGNAFYALVPDRSYQVVLSAYLYVTVTQHLDLGAHLDPNAFGLEARMGL